MEVVLKNKNIQVFNEELKNLETIWGCDKDLEVIDKRTIKIDPELYVQAYLRIRLSQVKDYMHDWSEDKIKGFKKALKRGDKFPAIALEEYDNMLMLVDGAHRIIAMYEFGIKTCKAIYIKREKKYERDDKRWIDSRTIPVQKIIEPAKRLYQRTYVGWTR